MLSFSIAKVPSVDKRIYVGHFVQGKEARALRTVQSFVSRAGKIRHAPNENTRKLFKQKAVKNHGDVVFNTLCFAEI